MRRRRNQEPTERGSGIVVSESPSKSGAWRRWLPFTRRYDIPLTRTEELKEEAFSDPEDDEAERNLIEHEEHRDFD